MVVSTTGVASKERVTSPESVERKPKGLRSKDGCLTCRIRRKKCDQGKQADSCESCRRLHIECLGYSRNRPEWLKGVKVEDFKRMIKRFLAENSPKSGLHSRQDATVPVPFLSFESLRSRADADVSMSVGPSGSQYGVAGPGPSLVDSMVLDKLVEDSDGSDEEAPRHYQLLPLPKKDSSLPFTREHTPSANQDNRLENGDMDIDKREPETLPSRGSPTRSVQLGEERREEVNVEIDPAIMGPPAEDPELVYYVGVVFPVLHELAGFNLSSQELLMFAQRDKAIGNVLRAQAKHHQNRMRFLTSAEEPHHPATQQLCRDLADTNNAHVNALAALGPSFENATRHNETSALAALYTLLHFGGLGDLLARHNSSRRSGHIAPAGTGFILEMSCQWLAGAIALSGDLASALKRGGDRQRAMIQAAIHIDIFASISLCRPPHFLDAYRASFKHSDTLSSTDKNGVRVAVEPRLDDLLDIPAKTLLALAETAAMASWKVEHVRQGSLSVMDLSRWAKRIDALLAPPLPESVVPATPIPSATATRMPTTPSLTKMLPVIAPVVPVVNASPSASHSPARAARATSTTSDASTSLVRPASRPSAPEPTEPPSIGGSSHVVQAEAAKDGRPVVDSAIDTTAVQVTSPPPSSSTIQNQTALHNGAEPTAKTSKSSAPIDSTSPAPLPATVPASAKPNSRSVPPPVPQAPVPPHAPPPPAVEPLVRPAYRRTLPPSTREVFRCAGRVFLHSTLSGEHPRVHDIAQAVSDTCSALRELGLSYLPPGTKPTPADDLRFPVVRGLPFCIFIAGSVAGNMEQGMFLRSCLRPVVREVDMQTAELLTAVLSERAGTGDVSWQSVMIKRGTRPIFM